VMITGFDPAETNMSIFDIPDEKKPFLVPFAMALALGIPVAVTWFLVATKFGFLAKITTTLLGCACGYGARMSARGWHSAEAAILSTLILIILGISMITLAMLAAESGHSVLILLVRMILDDRIAEFPNACVIVAGNSAIGYPMALYAAYRISDAS